MKFFLKKSSTNWSFIWKRHTTYKIGSLINKKNSYNFFFHMLQVSKKFPTVYITGSLFSIMYNRNLRVLIELLENYNPFDFDSLLKLGELWADQLYIRTAKASCLEYDNHFLECFSSFSCGSFVDSIKSPRGCLFLFLSSFLLKLYILGVSGTTSQG